MPWFQYARLALKQSFCPHNSRASRHWVEYDDNGRPLIRGQGRCLDCGKGVLSSGLSMRQTYQMLREAEKQTGAD